MRSAAYLFSVLAGIVILFQVALALGVPWGHLAMGGQYPGSYPPPMRAAALGQAVLLAAEAAVLLGRAGALAWRAPLWAAWVVVAISAVSALLNLITPSAAERRLWLPVAVLMLAFAIAVAIGRRRRDSPRAPR